MGIQWNGDYKQSLVIGEDMEKKIRECIAELRTIVERIDLNYAGLESMFRRKKYANLKFVHNIEDIVVRQQEVLEQQQEALKKYQKELEKCIADIDEIKRKYGDKIQELLVYKEENEKCWKENRSYQEKNERYKEENEKYKRANDKYQEETRRYREEIKKYRGHMEKQFGATARQLMKIKWNLIDAEVRRVEKPEDILHCKICGYEAKRNSFATKEAECRFNGGKLIRYICPECGVIFGPTKFSVLTQDEINDDYTIHYVGFHEGDSTQKELDAFYMLKPDKNKIYLNYGCGSWSKSLDELHEKGFQVFGYEPYAPETDNPYIITDKDAIQKMRFDGIYSNDLIEHLINPVEDFTFMKGLLKDKCSWMSHSTSCYIYKHEVTRFHTHFFTGRSIEVLCEKSGMRVIERVNEVDTKDFICYVYEPKDLNMEYIDKLCGLKKEQDEYILEQNGTMYGPYLTVSGGHYRWLLQLECIPEEAGKVECRITEQNGKETLKIVRVGNGDNIIEINLERIIPNMEFVIENKTGEKIKVKKLQMLDVDE